MTPQHEELMEVLANRDFIFVEETDAVVYEKKSNEETQTITMVKNTGAVLHENYNKNGMLTSSTGYDITKIGSTARLLRSIR